MSAVEAEGTSQKIFATVMLADISGFTALSEKLDPEDVTRVMNGCFAKLESIVFAHGGVIEGFLGDCVKAIFGITPSSNPTRLAVRAALEIRDAVADYNREAELPSPLGIHIGVNSGSIVTIPSGYADGSLAAIGDAVRLVNALEDHSVRGEIFVGPETYERTRDEFNYRPRDPIALPPHPAPFAVYELLGTRRSPHVRRASERRMATVLFAEVLGLEALAADCDAITYAELIKGLYKTLSAAVTAHEGVIDKYLGEGLMALFGVPNAIENAPRQAVNAAIAMRRACRRYAAEHAHGHDLAIKIGINTGLVIAGEIGGRVKRDFTVMGDAVNLAARLKYAAPADTILLGPRTLREVGDHFEYGAELALRLSGISEPVPAREVLSEATQVHRRTPTRGIQRLETAIVGRDAELAVFHANLDAVLAGRGAIVNVEGEAGLGKSRLLAEALRTAEARGVQVLTGRCLAIGHGMSFHLFDDLFRDWLEAREDADDLTLDKLERAVAGVLGDAGHEVVPFVARLMGLDVDAVYGERLAGVAGEALERMIFKSVRHLIEAIARRRPTMLVVEDLHWIDQSSLNLLEELLPLVAQHGILFVHLYRPLHDETSGTLAALCRQRLSDHTHEMRLGPLTSDAAGELIRNLLQLDELPARLRDRIAGKAEGNPFYIEEVVRSLIDQGVIVPQDGRYRITDAIDTTVIPSTVQEVIMARVDRLPESARHLLQVSSVIGRQFFRSIVAAVLAEDDERLERDLQTLRQKQLIEEPKHGEAGGVVGDDATFVFRHALAQETIYSSLLLATRKDLHARVGEAIEQRFEDRLTEFFPVLGHHFMQANRLASAEPYLFGAGEEALRSAAFAEALRFFHQSSTVYQQLYPEGGDPQHLARIEKNLALSLLNTGQLTACIDHFDAALRYLGRPLTTSQVSAYVGFAGNLMLLLAQLYLKLGRRRKVVDWEQERMASEILFNRARAEITSDPTRLFFESVAALRHFHEIDARQVEQSSAIYASAAGMFCYSGISFSIGKRIMRQARTLVHEGNVQQAFTCASMEFIIRYLEGDWADGHVVDENLLDEALRHGQLWDANTYLGLYCDRLLRQGRFAEARTILRRLETMRDDYGYSFAGTNRDGMTALLLVEERDLGQAQAAAARYREQVREEPLQVLAIGTQAKIEVLRGDLAAAESNLQVAEEIIARTPTLPPWHLSAAATASLLYSLERLQHAAAGERRTLARRLRRHLRHATRIAAKVAVQRAEITRLAALAHWRLGEHARAHATWRRAMAIGTKLGAQPELARLSLDLSACGIDPASVAPRQGASGSERA